jgi:hypothetical protein
MREVYTISHYEPRMEDNDVMRIHAVAETAEGIAEATGCYLNYVQEKMRESPTSFLLGKSMSAMWSVQKIKFFK